MCSLIVAAWKYCWLRFSIAFLLGAGGGYGVLRMTTMEPERLFNASTAGVRNVAVPAMNRAAVSGIDPSIVIFLANTIAMLLLASFLFTAGLYDPSRVNDFPAWFRRQAQKDPTISIFALSRGFRTINTPALRPLFATLIVAPMAGAVALGLLIGVIFISHTFLAGGGSQGLFITLAYLVPHGIPEVGGLLLGTSVPVSAYLRIKESLDGGDAGGTFAQLREASISKTVLPVLGGAIFLLVCAALIETHLTDRLGSIVQGLI